MKRNLSHTPEQTDTKASGSLPEAAPAYSAPHLVVLGRAHTLVQGTDLYKNTQDANRNFRD